MTTVRQEPAFSPNALRTLHSRYLWKDRDGKVVETPAELLDRVAGHVAAAERRYAPDRAESVREAFYRIMAQGRFLPNSPTLMNAGRPLGMLSACFVLPIDDSIEGIFDSVKHTAQIQKAGGGTGFSFDRLRPTGDYITSSGGRTSGPISFWRVFAEATRAIQQGAFRRGANMGMMSVTHPDILKFVTAKNRPGEFENFNISVKAPDAFMADLRADPRRPHAVTNPHTGRRYLLPRALDVRNYVLDDLSPLDGDDSSPPCYTVGEIWGLIVASAHATGEPGLCFIDRVNADNPTPRLGRIEATNPCGEQPLLDYEACNLGSVDVSKFVTRGRLDEGDLRAAIRLGVRFLDDVIDVNNYMVEAIARLCLGNRKIGIGVMGLADAMLELGIKYDSDEGLALARRIAALLADEAQSAGEELARERGTFANYPGSLWEARGRPMRNAALTTVAPTGTISILAGCSGGIEPVFSLAFYRHVLSGQELLEVNAPFERHAKQRGFWSDDLALRLASGERLADIEGIDDDTRRLFVTAHDIEPQWHIRMQAAFQEHVDGAISKTVNLPHDAAPAAVDDAFRLAFELKCKGVTVYRDRCRQDQPMSLQPDAPGQPQHCPRCQTPLDSDAACVRCPTCGATLCG